MKNISSIKTNNAESPKTPGGISRSLLTPCKRVGLSRNWKRSGPSPFISPLSSSTNTTDVKQENEVRKRKKCLAEVLEETERKNIVSNVNEETGSVSRNTPQTEIDRTPTRTLLPRKKSKTFVVSKECVENFEQEPQNIAELNVKNDLSSNDSIDLEDSNKHSANVSKLSRKNSNSKLTLLKSPAKLNFPVIETSVSGLSNCNNDIHLENRDSITNKKRSPNNLTSKCVVIIQKKIFKNSSNSTSKNEVKENLTPFITASQTLLDSDSDDMPLCNINRTDNNVKGSVVESTIQNSKGNYIEHTKVDDDFVENKNVIIKRLEDKTTSTSGLRVKVKKKNFMKPDNKIAPQILSQSSNSFEEDSNDDDFVSDKKRTILIKKTYNKTTKLSLKAKSTGSITQKDIDDINARIESKKSLLLVKAMSNETQELRVLIKKWQTGCQTALTELLELMKKKMPEQNMEHSDLLQMLKIPPDLVGYDSESDCFKTPDDANIILSALKID